MDNPQSTEFESKASIKESIRCRVTKYSSNTKDIYSWEAEMIKTDDFEETSKEFRSIYDSLQHLSVNVNETNAILKENMLNPQSP